MTYLKLFILLSLVVLSSSCKKEIDNIVPVANIEEVVLFEEEIVFMETFDVNGNIIMLDSSNGFYRSFGGGAYQFSEGPLTDKIDQIVPIDLNVIYVRIGSKCFKTSNGGNSWEFVTTCLSFGKNHKDEILFSSFEYLGGLDALTYYIRKLGVNGDIDTVKTFSFDDLGLYGFSVSNPIKITFQDNYAYFVKYESGSHGIMDYIYRVYSFEENKFRSLHARTDNYKSIFIGNEGAVVNTDIVDYWGAISYYKSFDDFLAEDDFATISQQHFLGVIYDLKDGLAVANCNEQLYTNYYYNKGMSDSFWTVIYDDYTLKPLEFKIKQIDIESSGSFLFSDRENRVYKVRFE